MGWVLGYRDALQVTRDGFDPHTVHNMSNVINLNTPRFILDVYFPKHKFEDSEIIDIIGRKPFRSETYRAIGARGLHFNFAVERSAKKNTNLSSE